ncbi:glycosyltransferase family 4 protein [Ottowia thiooxydans]|uniref:glycosyltransferase family 4 protein n=1 Tax=Ottowia thiooxydans TaxID=219182 RepID=UPI000417CAC0|nr:glycosyltransferase family 1 protein [Ottowia thiooxydans]
MSRLNLVVAVDAIAPPLTGIGRYAYELVKGLQSHSEIGNLRYFSFGRWMEDPIARTAREAQAKLSSEATNETPEPPRRSLRSMLARVPVAVKAYQLVTPSIYRLRLQTVRDSIFHSPNYFVPKFPGPTVSTTHDLSHMRYPQFHPEARVNYMNAALPRSLRMTNHIITDSQAVRQEVIEDFGWSEDRVTAIGLGTDPSFSPRSPQVLAACLSRYGLRAGGYSLFVGTIEARKNVDRLLSAYEALPLAMRKEWPLVLVGDTGWRSEHTHERMRVAEAAGWLRYLKYLPQEDLPYLYSGARLFVYPSVYEGFGLPIAEAMASGVPVITSNVSSMPEVAGGAARLIDPLNVDELHHAILDSLQNGEWRRQAIAAGLTRAQDFSWQACVDRTVEVYKHLT